MPNYTNLMAEVDRTMAPNKRVRIQPRLLDMDQCNVSRSSWAHQYLDNDKCGPLRIKLGVFDPVN